MLGPLGGGGDEPVSPAAGAPMSATRRRQRRRQRLQRQRRAPLGEDAFLSALTEGGVADVLAGGVLRLVRAAAAVRPHSVVVTGSVAIAAAQLSERREYGDVDVSCVESDFGAVVAALQAAAATLAGFTLTPAAATTTWAAAANPAPPLGRCFTGHTAAFALQHTPSGASFVVQVAVRGDAWTPAQLVGGYYSSHMGALFACEAGGGRCVGASRAARRWRCAPARRSSRRSACSCTSRRAGASRRSTLRRPWTRR